MNEPVNLLAEMVILLIYVMGGIFGCIIVYFVFGVLFSWLIKATETQDEKPPEPPKKRYVDPIEPTKHGKHYNKEE